MKEKAIKYLKLCRSEDIMLENFVKMLSNAMPIPSNVWVEIFMALDTSVITEKHADIISNNFNEDEIDELIEFAKSPAFAKYVSNYSEYTTAMQNALTEWLKNNKDVLIPRIKFILNKNNIEGDLAEMAIAIFESC